MRDSAQIRGYVKSIHEKYPYQKIFVAGDGQGGRVAWEAATEMSNEVAAGAGCGFLTLDLAPEFGGKLLHQEFLVIHSIYDDSVPANATIRAQRKTAFTALSLMTVLNSNELNHSSVQWTYWVTAVDKFFTVR